MKTKIPLSLLLLSSVSGLLLGACSDGSQKTPTVPVVMKQNDEQVVDHKTNPRFDIYKKVKLTSDLSHLSDSQKQMLAILIDASKIVDDLFWKQAFGNKSKFLQSIENPLERAFAVVNYGPWDRLDGDKPFISSYSKKPLGAQFYPEDMTKDELTSSKLADEKGLYSLVKRDEQGKLYTIPYHQAFRAELLKVALLLRQAAKLAENTDFKKYLELRAEALVSDKFQESDLAWMDMKTNPIELVIGPIETYEDLLLGYRTAYESYVLIKDMAWSAKLAKYAAFLPDLQKGLPVPAKYKSETPGTNSDLNAYDVVYYAGHSNAGSKTIAINLPNDEEVQLAKGTRRLQLKNAMQAKFENIMIPIAQELIAEDQRQFITFDAFFANTMFHEVAHGLGIKNTLTGKGTVRSNLKEAASALEEGKADILGLYMVSKLYESGDITEGKLMDNYVTFLAGIFRSIRFGASSAHGKANMMRFNFFKELGAFSRNEKTGLYRVNFDAMTVAMNELSKLILTLQGDGDYAGAVTLLSSKGIIGNQLAEDLARLESASIPVDIVFEQGKDILGLNKN